MIHRLLPIPLNENAYKKELNTIKLIADNNGYNVSLIDDLIKKKDKRMANKLAYNITPENKNTQRWKKLSYIGKASTKIGNKLLENNIRPAYYCPNNLRKIFQNKKCVDKQNLNGIYRINCDTCPGVYIGQTGRAFKTRLKEHKNGETI